MIGKLVGYGLASRKLVLPAAIITRAKRIFGTTKDPTLANWILPDGTLLNCSKGRERHHVGRPFCAREHAEIAVAFNLDDDYNIDRIADFMALGAIRLGFTRGAQTLAEHGYMQLTRAPSEAQHRRIREVVTSIAKSDDPSSSIAIDAGDGLHKTWTFPDVKVHVVMRAIDNAFAPRVGGLWLLGAALGAAFGGPVGALVGVVAGGAVRIRCK